MLRNQKLQKVISVSLLIQFLNLTFFPSISLALTSGPSQPEFSSFEPVSSSNMVDEFSGDFTYNLPVLEVPGPHGSGYPISLSYHSGVTPEEEASWVGYGWTLNAGAINRNTRGLPDDYNGKEVKFHNKMPKNWTATVGGGVAFGEVFGKDLKGIIGASVNGSIRYNNYRGFGYNAGVGISLGRGLVAMGYNVSDGSGSFSLNTNPFAVLNYNYGQKRQHIAANKERYLDKGLYKGFKDRKRTQIGGNINLTGSSYGMFSYTEASKPNVVHSYSGESFNVSIGITGNPVVVPVGGSANIFGSYTQQTNTPEIKAPGYGYMYSSGGGVDASSVMDYHVEHEKDFNPRDVFLGVPFNDADNFIVTGEGIGGGFRMYNKKAGHFGPRNMESKVDIYNVAGDIGAGWTFGPGGDLGKGETKLTLTDWSRTLSSFDDPMSTTQDEPVFFRFNNDLGGEWGDVHNDKPFQAALSGKNLSLSQEYFAYNAANKRSGRSSYIGYHTNQEMILNGNPSPAAYSKIQHVNYISGRTLPATLEERKELIGEIAVFNESGVQYNYGLPVYSRNEASLNYSVRGASPIERNFIAYTNSLNSEIKLGEEKNSQYASTYLLTEILSPDYNDYGQVTTSGEFGSSPDDAGGYTRFNYKNVFAPGAGDWYNWRAPYRGLLYNKGSHSDALDDTGGFSAGEKEIYFLHSIETKTHVAIFQTENREDSREAPGNAHQQGTAFGIQQLQKLMRIELYAISDFQTVAGKLEREEFGSPKLKTTGNPKPIKTVYFEYNNSLSSGLPNAGGSVGKLTLKRVYFEYNGIGKTRISPYEFSYEYPSNSYASYPEKYKTAPDDVTADYRALTANDQNPPYSRFFSDPWGNYQPNGELQFDSMRTWIDQNVTSNKNGFDPAAWHLKRITLPSGGQIHVQYEQDDYSFVQDQEAHVMAKLKTREGPAPPAFKNVYKIDLSVIGLRTDMPDYQKHLNKLKAMIDKRYVSGKSKIYFKMLYSLVGDDSPDLSTCNADFITGYASVVSCEVNNSTNELSITLMDGNHRLPDQVCEDFVKAERLGKVLPGQNCDPSRGVSDGNDPKSVILQLHSMAANVVVPQLCKNVNLDYSYLRIPTPIPKKGGGVRVKRLLMFDTGLEGGPVLYGNEYLYQTKDGSRTISSGVATNEPQTIREENILTDFVARKNQDVWSKIVAGRDKDKAEGPLGETILPGPSVGYSKVIIKNIHSGKSNPGFSINEFYTAKDFPVTLAHPDKAGTMTTIKKATPEKKNLITPFYTDVRNKTWATQGFSFVLNNMHGQLKSTFSYSGPYTDVLDLAKSTVVSSATYEYFKPGEKIPMMSSLFGGVTMKSPGREVDLTFSQRKVTEKQSDVNVEVDLQITIIPLAFIVLVIPYPTAIPSFSNVEGELHTHSTTKVVRYPSILKKVEVYQDGILHNEENMAFDANTGKPVAVRSSDEFKGAYLAQSIPANWEYKAMKGKWDSENKTVTGSFNFSNNYISVASAACSLAEFTPGDKIRLGENTSSVFYHVTELDWVGNGLRVQPVFGSSTAAESYTKMTIVRSGRTNQLQQQAGGITIHSEVKDNLKPVTLDQANRYETYTANTFIEDLRNATKDLSSGSGNFNLTREYTLMDMSAFADRLTTCNTDLTKARVKQIEYAYFFQNGQLMIDLMSFDIDCNGTWVSITAEGWTN